MTTTADILGEPPEHIIGAVFREALVIVPEQAFPQMTTHLLSSQKSNLMYQLREQCAIDKGNAVVGLHMTVHPAAPLTYLLGMGGTLVYSKKWEDHIHETRHPILIPFVQPQSAAPTPPPQPETTNHVPVDDEDRPDVGGNKTQMNRFKQQVNQNKGFV